MSKKVIITAADTLFFGSGRPFTMSEDSWTLGIFPPFPETLFSFLRGCFFLDNMNEYNNAGEANDPTKGLVLENFGIIMEDRQITEKLYPLPLDLVKNINTDKPEILILKKNELISNRKDLSCKLISDTNSTTRNFGTSFYLRETDFINYLNENYKDLNPFNLGSSLTGEPKIGIRRNRKNQKDKALYRINLTRLKTEKYQIKLWLQYDGIAINIDKNRLGGEAKMVFLDKAEEESNLQTNFHCLKGSLIRMYVATPAIFKEGWKPPFTEGLELLTAVVGKPHFIGGFDAKLHQPKPTIKVVPAGSVYYFKAKKNMDLPLKIGVSTKKGYGNVIYTILNLNNKL